MQSRLICPAFRLLAGTQRCVASRGRAKRLSTGICRTRDLIAKRREASSA